MNTRGATATATSALPQQSLSVGMLRKRRFKAVLKRGLI